MTDPINSSEVGQTEYMKLFMQELTYQDPLKPVDNREFMAQMAQFSALQQTVTTNQNLDKLIKINYGNRGISLLNESVKIMNSESYGEVRAIRFANDGTPEVRVAMENGGEGSWVGVDQITEVQK